MRRSNWIVYAVLVVFSAFLLWLWYALNFNSVDSPLDLLLSVCWWVLVVVAALFIRNREKARCEAVNTCYVAPLALFNSEAGLVQLEPGEEPVAKMQQILENLKYNFHMEPFPGEEDEQGNRSKRVDFVYVVRTSKFSAKKRKGDKPEDGQDEEPEWEGEVAVVVRPNDDPCAFASKQELQSILANHGKPQAAAEAGA